MVRGKAEVFTWSVITKKSGMKREDFIQTSPFIPGHLLIYNFLTNRSKHNTKQNEQDKGANHETSNQHLSIFA